MPSTYTSNNKIQKIATGEQSGTWGATTNTNFDLFDTAIDGFVSVSLSGTTHTLNIPDGSAGDGRNKVLIFTGSLSGANTVTVTPNTVKKHYFVQNNTTGGQNIIIAQGSGSTVTVKPGYSSVVYLDGAGSGAAVKEVLTGLKLTALIEATGAVLVGSSSGSTTLQASATASGTLTLPAATDTLVGKATTDTLTNKTFDTAGTGNVFRINGTQVSAVTGSGAAVLATSPTITTPTVTTSAIIPVLNGGSSASSTLTLQSTSGAGTTDSIIFKTASQSERMRITTDGRIGFGNPSPAYNYTFSAIDNTTGATNAFGSNLTINCFSEVSASPASNPAAARSYFGSYSSSYSATGGSNVSLIGARSISFFAGSTATSLAYGGSCIAQNAGTATITDAAGLSSAVYLTSTGSITNAYTVLAASPVQLSSGTITNAYGVYIGNQSVGTNKWNLYVESGSDNYIGGNLKIGGTANRATTPGTSHLSIFNGTAPVGTLANGISIYSSSGEAYVMDAAGNATLFSPHDRETNEWIFDSTDTNTGKRLKIDVEKLLRFINDHFGLDCVHEFVKES